MLGRDESLPLRGMEVLKDIQNMVVDVYHAQRLIETIKEGGEKNQEEIKCEHAGTGLQGGLKPLCLRACEFDSHCSHLGRELKVRSQLPFTGGG